MSNARVPSSVALLATLFMGLSQAADPPTSPIRLPVVQQELPKPMPADAAVTLSPDVSYVIESDSECLLFPSPGGAISITREAGPVKLRGVFIGGSGKKEWKKFDAKFVYVVDAVKDGRDELIIVPVGAKSETDAKRVTFQVGKMPQPPPDDPKPDDSKPPVSVNPFGTTKGLHVMMTFRDNFPLPIGQHNIIYGGTMREYLNAKCETPDSYRIWKTNTQTKPDDPTIWKVAFARKRTADEWILIGNGTSGYEGPLPATVEETLALIKKYEGK